MNKTIEEILKKYDAIPIKYSEDISFFTDDKEKTRALILEINTEIQKKNQELIEELNTEVQKEREDAIHFITDEIENRIGYLQTISSDESMLKRRELEYLYSNIKTHLSQTKGGTE